MISDYFKKVKEAIESFDHIVVDSETSEKIYSRTKGYIKGDLHFTDESRLGFAELKDTGKDFKAKYRYHYMNNENELIFRYDNAEHHPEIKTFPHHKHIPGAILESQEPEIKDVLSEIEPIVVDD